MERQYFAFGPFTVDRKRRLLLKQGEPVRLGQRGIAILDALLSAEGRIVSKAELMDIAWPRQSVEESNLSVQIAALRKCLGTRPDGQEWIATVPRVGYQLLDTLPKNNVTSPADVLAASKGTASPSIAVPPFENLSDDPAQNYFSDGITEDVRTELTRIAGLAVIAWSSVLLHKNRHADPREIGARLGVTHILVGSVRRADDRVRINVQLVNCADSTSLWADRYDRDLTDIFRIQEEIAEAIAAMLKLQLIEDRPAAADMAPTLSMTAYDYCLQARHLYHMHTIQHVVMARRMFQKAIEFDRNYARAYAGLAFAGCFLYAVHHPAGRVDEILESCAKALELEPGLAEAHAALGLALVRADRPAEAVSAFERAIVLNPNLFEAHYQYTEALTDLEDWGKAAACYRHALEISPEDYRCQLMLGQMYRALGQPVEAEATERAGIASAERVLALHPDMSLAATLGADALARLGEKARALEWVERALTIDPDTPLTQYNAACCLAQLGENARALELLERWAEGAHLSTLKWIEGDTDLKSLRDHPRFQGLLARIRRSTPSEHRND